MEPAALSVDRYQYYCDLDAAPRLKAAGFTGSDSVAVPASRDT